MIRDITLGQYYNSDSLIHRLDPRLKIIAVILFIAELFVAGSFIGFALCAAALSAGKGRRCNWVAASLPGWAANCI